MPLQEGGSDAPAFSKLSVLISATYQILICDTKKKHWLQAHLRYADQAE